MRDRAADLLAEEADLAAHPGRDLGRHRRPHGDHGFPRLHLAVRPAARPHRRRRRGRVASAPEGPDAPTGARRSGWDPVVGDGSAASSRQLRDARWPTATASWWPPTARARPPGSPRCSATRAARRRRGRDPTAGRRHRGRAARAGLRPARRQARRARRGRPHRPAPGPPPGPAPPPRRRGLLRRPQARRLRRAPPARRRPLRRHGHAGHRRRRARLPAARVPGRRQALRPVRPDRRRPPLHRRRDAHAHRLGGAELAEDQGQGARRRSPRSPRSWSCSTRSGCSTPGHAFAPDTPWQRELEEAFPYEETPDQLKAIDDVKADMEAAHARWTAWCAATSASARPRSPSGPRSRRCRTASRWRCWCPPRCWPSSTSRPSASASPATRCGSRCCPASSRPARPGKVVEGVEAGRGRRRHRHPPPAVRATSRSRTSACWWSTRSSASASHKEADQAAAAPTSTCSRSPPRPSPARWR